VTHTVSSTATPRAMNTSTARIKNIDYFVLPVMETFVSVMCFFCSRLHGEPSYPSFFRF